MIVCDTGPLAAAADRDDQHNRACMDPFTVCTSRGARASGFQLLP
jgi:hypothetical protein